MRKLEGNADAADALRLWAARNRGMQTYAHMIWNRILLRRFMRRSNERSARVPGPSNGTGYAIRPCMRETNLRATSRGAGLFEVARLPDRARSVGWEDYLWEHGVCAVLWRRRCEGR